MSNWDGMYPQHNCKQCDKPLNPNGHRPAELYAGSYTGLCYSCQNLPAYIVNVYKIDNCLIVSHPPSSPSHRRDRAEHYGYIDCKICKGSGGIRVFRSHTLGGSYTSYCEACLNKYYAQPMRREDGICREEVENKEVAPYKKELDKKFNELIPEQLKKPFSEYTQEDKDLWASIAKPLLDDYDNFRKKATQIYDIMYGAAYEKVEYKPGVILLK